MIVDIFIYIFRARFGSDVMALQRKLCDCPLMKSKLIVICIHRQKVLWERVYYVDKCCLLSLICYLRLHGFSFRIYFFLRSMHFVSCMQFIWYTFEIKMLTFNMEELWKCVNRVNEICIMFSISSSAAMERNKRERMSTPHTHNTERQSKVVHRAATYFLGPQRMITDAVSLFQ